MSPYIHPLRKRAGRLGAVWLLLGIAGTAIQLLTEYGNSAASFGAIVISQVWYAADWITTVIRQKL